MPHCISTDNRVLDFVKKEATENELQHILEQEQKAFVQQSLLKGFNWQKIQDRLQQHTENLMQRQLPNKEQNILWTRQMLAQTASLSEVSQKFVRQLEQLYAVANGGYQLLYDRTKAAVDYFSKAVDEQLITPVEQHFEASKKEKKVKKYLNELLELKTLFLRQKQVLLHTLQLAEALLHADEDLLLRAQEIHQPVAVTVKETDDQAAKTTSRLPKGETARLSLQLYKEGKTIAEIASHRNLTYSTIEGHLAAFIPTGEVQIEDLITSSKLEQVLNLLKKEKEPPSSSTLKSRLGQDFSYGEIKAALKYWEKEKGMKA